MDALNLDPSKFPLGQPVFRLDWISGYGDANGTHAHFTRDRLVEDAGFDDDDMAEIDRMQVGEEIPAGGPCDRVTLSRVR